MTMFLPFAALLAVNATLPPGSIRKASETYLLDRDLLASPAVRELRASVRPVETRSAGGRRGWIVPGNELEELGIQAGDIVLAIDGKAPDAGGRVLGKALGSGRIVVDLERRRQPLRIIYTVKKLPPLPEAPEDETMLEAGIRKVADDEYELPRSVLETTLADSRKLSLIRVAPVLEAGTVHGFRLLSIRPESILTRVGLMDGDVVLRINGQEVSTPDDALSCYASLRSTKELNVELQRGGAVRRIKIHLR